MHEVNRLLPVPPDRDRSALPRGPCERREDLLRVARSVRLSWPVGVERADVRDANVVSVVPGSRHAHRTNLRCGIHAWEYVMHGNADVTRAMLRTPFENAHRPVNVDIHSTMRIVEQFRCPKNAGKMDHVVRTVEALEFTKHVMAFASIECPSDIASTSSSVNGCTTNEPAPASYRNTIPNRLLWFVISNIGFGNSIGKSAGRITI